MTHFGDDVFVGGAKGTPTPGVSEGDSASGYGVGPIGRCFLWDLLPLAKQVNNLALAQELAGAGALTLTPGTGVTRLANSRGETVLQLDCPRAVSITGISGTAAGILTVVGYDYTGQKMSEAITFAGDAITAEGKKAFHQILSASFSAASVETISVGTTDIFGVPVRITDKGYMATVKWDDALSQNAGTLVKADQTDPATTTTGDVRGTYLPTTGADGVRRLISLIALPAIASGPNATRKGAYGANQNLYNQ